MVKNVAWFGKVFTSIIIVNLINRQWFSVICTPIETIFVNTVVKILWTHKAHPLFSSSYWATKKEWFHLWNSFIQDLLISYSLNLRFKFKKRTCQMGSKALQRSTLIQMIFSIASKGVFPISLIIIVVSRNNS